MKASGYWRRAALLMMVVMAVVGCSSGATTTTEDAVTTTDAPATTQGETDNGSVSALSDMPAECLDAFDDFLLDIEPLVENFDFNNATQADFEEFAGDMEDVSAPFEEMTTNCPELDLEGLDSIQAMREYAADVAPGTVAYFEYIEAVMGSSSVASGDCEADIEALMAYVEGGTPMNELTLTDVTTVSGLLQAVSTECSAERFAEFVGDPEVSAFLGG